MTATVEQESFFTETKNPEVAFLWLEITGVCNLKCVHCYAESGPAGQRDSVGTRRWVALLQEAAALGVRAVQFIGGEPLVHPDIAALLEEARALGLESEIFSNLTYVRESLWCTFKEQRVSLATSFYSCNSSVHDQITQRTGSWTQTVTNIKRAVEYGLPLRVGIIDIRPDQDIKETTNFLRGLGVLNIGTDRMRGIGRGAKAVSDPCPADELCGACTGGKLAIDQNGQAHPCVFARWLNVGNVRDMSLAAVAGSGELASARQLLDAAFASRPKYYSSTPCHPDAATCGPGGCNPNCTPNPTISTPDPTICTPNCTPTCNPAFPP